MKTRMKTFVTLFLLGAGASAAHAQGVEQVPLTVSAGVPGNMLLTPSVEFPTINSKANLGAFAAATTYVGYFDPLKCYTYVYNATESLRYFSPSRVTATPAVCSAASMEWSGNWLNWATTQTIDPFRKALTGGLRVRDTATETWLEKARHDGQGGLGYFPNATTTAAATISGALPNSTWTSITTRVVGGGSEMYFTNTRVCAAVDVIGAAALPTNSATQQVVDYNPAVHVLNAANSNSPVVNTDCDASAAVNNQPQTNANRIYRVSVRVKVCVAGMIEPNCVQYTGGGYKPDGLIQKYQRKIRFSVFGYLLDNGAFRDGGVLRANQKYVGPQYLNRDTRAWEPNTLREWNDDGTFIDNPNPADALATQTAVNGGTVTHPIRYSGVINYINRFAQLTGTNAKNYDPVSELYYTATRYLRALGPVSTYNDLNVRYTSATGVATTAGVDRFNLTDGFPVITRWEDPYEYSCQNSAILGIGDVYTHKDKNLKGDTQSSTATNEPARPAAVSSDPMINDVPTWTQRAYAIEGVPYNATLNTGLNNSPYMVGLAYYAHTQDLRTEASMPGKQRISTHWVDVRETQVVEPRVRNQYWMAAKYGGFNLPGEDTPDDASDDYNSLTNTTALPNAWWASTDSITSNSGTWTNETFRRTSNYYVADRPATMVDSLTRAFANIAAERSGSGSALAANSTRLDMDTRTFQAQFRSGSWQGQLTAHDFDLLGGNVDPVPIWRAGEKMPLWSARNIRVSNGGTTAAVFTYANLTATQKTAMNALNTALAVTGTQVVDYIRGSQAKEQSQTNGTLRTRPTAVGWSPILGDIVNSTPTYVGKPNKDLWAKNPGTWTGKDTYAAWADSLVGRTPVVWVGANDGMLHAFNATEGNALSGSEIFAFVPNAAIMNGLVNVVDPDYQHRYFVDGDMAIADVYAGGSWRTILVATMGRGAPAVFALDITNPASVQFLWERSQAQIPDLGHNIGRPIIAQVSDGNWRVLFGNGTGSVARTAKLISIDVMTGASTSFSTDDSVTDNDLSGVVAFDSDLDGLFETVYAGDLKGNIWKITNLTGTGSALKLFTATDGTNPQPITAAPTVGKDPASGAIWVWFGTGRFLEQTDIADLQLQSWYGIRDTGVLVDRSQLQQRRLTRNPTDRYDFNLRTLEVATAGDMAGDQGWFINFETALDNEPGERMVVPNILVGQSLVGVTRSPAGGDACLPAFTSWFMAINPFTGARLNENFWDISRDNLLNRLDDSTEGEIVTGIRRTTSVGGANAPIVVGSLLCTTMDDGSTQCLRVRGSNADARRGSWREITN